MKKRKLVKTVSMLLILVTVITSVSVVGYAGDRKDKIFKVSPEECDCICHGYKIPDDMTDSKEDLVVLPIVLLPIGVGYGLGKLLKMIEWFFTFRWYCKCGKPHFEGMVDLS